MPKLTVARYRFCKVENAVEMLSDGYNRFCPKTSIFEKWHLGAKCLRCAVKYREMHRTKAYLTAQVKARTAFGQWFLDGRKICSHSRPQSPSFLGHVVLRL